MSSFVFIFKMLNNILFLFIFKFWNVIPLPQETKVTAWVVEK